MHPYVYQLLRDAGLAPVRDEIPAGAGSELLTTLVYQLLQDAGLAPARDEMRADAGSEPLQDAGLAPARDEMPAGAASELLTTLETARRLRLAKQTLARWRCEGRGPPLGGVGGRVAYRTADVDAWLKSRRASSTTEADRLGASSRTRAAPW